MSRTYTKKEIAHLIGRSVRTIESYASDLNIEPKIGDRNQNLYSESDFNLISQLNSHCKDPNNSRKSFVPLTNAEVVHGLDLEYVEPKEKIYYQVDKPNKQELVLPSRSELYKRCVDFNINEDPLFDLELLERVYNNHWTLTSKKLAAILDITPKTLNTYIQYYHCGFIATRMSFGKKIFWKLTKNEWSR